jgi:teichoic acid transport system permease protein
MAYARSVWHRREFAWYLAMGNLKARNASTALGVLWWMINPLLLGGVYWLVFGVLFDRGANTFGAPFLVYLLSGMFPFHFTQTSMTGGVNSIVGNTKLLANLHFPRSILPIASLIEGMVGFLASLGAFFLVVGPIHGVWPTAASLWLLPTVAAHVIFNLGLSMAVARLAVPFRDLNNMIPYVTRMWLYMSPILYSEKRLRGAPEFVRRVAELNPMTPILRLYRFGLGGIPTDVSRAAMVVGVWAVAALVVGGVWFVRYEGKIARYI